MTLVRKLTQSESGKVWSVSCSGRKVTMESGSPGRERASEREFSDAEQADAFARGEEWARLRKGWVLVDGAAPAGQPRMHRFLGRAYTGALAVADLAGRLLCNQYDGTERLVLVDGDARSTAVAELPSGWLVWKACPVPSLDRVLLEADHQILSWSPSSGRIDPLTSGNTAPASFLSVAGTRAPWYDEPDVVVRDLGRGGDLLRHRLVPRLHAGHSPQMAAALSQDGARLACCATPGEIIVLDVERGVEISRCRGDFEMIDALLFTGDGRRLVATERYGRWSSLCFDPASGRADPTWPDLGDMANSDMALHPSGRSLAIASRGQVRLLELASLTFVGEFPLDHVVKRATIAWVGPDLLGAHTDAGCASLYAMT